MQSFIFTRSQKTKRKQIYLRRKEEIQQKKKAYLLKRRQNKAKFNFDFSTVSGETRGIVSWMRGAAVAFRLVRHIVVLITGKQQIFIRKGGE